MADNTIWYIIGVVILILVVGPRVGFDIFSIYPDRDVTTQYYKINVPQTLFIGESVPTLTIWMLEGCDTYERCPSGGCSGGNVLFGGEGYGTGENGANLCWTPEAVLNNINYQATMGEPNLVLRPGYSTVYLSICDGTYPDPNIVRQYCYDTNYKTAGHDCGPFMWCDDLLKGYDLGTCESLQFGEHEIEVFGYAKSCYDNGASSHNLYFRKKINVQCEQGSYNIEIGKCEIDAEPEEEEDLPIDDEEDIPIDDEEEDIPIDDEEDLPIVIPIDDEDPIIDNGDGDGEISAPIICYVVEGSECSGKDINICFTTQSDKKYGTLSECEQTLIVEDDEEEEESSLGLFLLIIGIGVVVYFIWFKDK